MQIIPATLPTEVRFSNEFTAAHYSYSAVQLNILYFLLSKLGSTPQNLVYGLSLAEFSAVNNKRFNYSYVWQEALDMKYREVIVRVDGIPTRLFLFEEVAYLEKKGAISLTLSLASIPFLFNLHNRFTSFNLKAALALSGKYDKRIYTLCARWKDKQATPFYTLESFKWMLALADSTEQSESKYAKFGHLNASILKPAITAINTHSDLFIGLEVMKPGRAVTKIRFAISNKAPVNHELLLLADEHTVDISSEKLTSVIRILDEYSIFRRDYRDRILSSREMILKTLKFSYDYKTSTKTIKSASGLLLTVLGLAGKKSR